MEVIPYRPSHRVNKHCLTSAAITNFSKIERDVKHGIHGCYVRPTHCAIPNSDKSPGSFRSVFSQREIVNHRRGVSCPSPQHEQHAIAQSHP